MRKTLNIEHTRYRRLAQYACCVCAYHTWAILLVACRSQTENKEHLKSDVKKSKPTTNDFTISHSFQFVIGVPIGILLDMLAIIGSHCIPLSIPSFYNPTISSKFKCTIYRTTIFISFSKTTIVAFNDQQSLLGTFRQTT